MEPFWRITLLGSLTLSPFRYSEELEAERDGIGEIRRFRSQRVAALLAYLALHIGRDCSRDALCEALWPEGDPEETRNRLRVALSSLRKQIEPPGIPRGSVLDTTVTNVVRLRAESVWVDVAAFEASVRNRDATAATFFAGELLPTFYDDWILSERERLNDLRQQAERSEGTRSLPAVASPSVVPGANKEVAADHALRSLNLPRPQRSRLPLYLTRFFGREAEQQQIHAFLAEGHIRLITLTGAGGQGKTRLSVEAAREQATRPLWFVALADLWEGDRLGEMLRDTLGLPRTSAPALPQVVSFLQAQAAPLLLLDNLEQIAPAAAPVLTTLLQQVPELTLLVTSRARLEIPGEREISVPPLLTAEQILPPMADLAAVSRHPAVALFVDRAQSARPDFQLTERNAPDILAICHLLEGIPLGLELAAARAASLTPTQMRQKLTEHWNALPAVGRTEKADRHRSLRAAIEWSVALLPQDQRRLFMQLAVFQGGATREAIEAVCESPHTLDTLTRLRANSLALLTEREGGFRYTLLETLRQWALEQQTPSEKRALAERHATWFYRFAEERKDRFVPLSGVAALEEMEGEVANFRAALTYCLTENPVRYVDLTLALTTFWENRSYFLEAQRWLEAAVCQMTDMGERQTEKCALLLLALGTVLGRQGDGNASLARLREAETLGAALSDSTQASIRWAMGKAFWLKGALPKALAQFQESRRLYEAERDMVRLVAAFSNIGITLRDLGDYEGARAAFTAAIAGAREHDVPRTLATALDNFASLLHVLGEEGARELYNECLALKRALGMRDGIAITLSNLAMLHCRQQDWEEGRRLTEETCTLMRETGNRRGLALAFNRLGQISDAEGKHDEAKRHFVESLDLRLALGNPHGIAIGLLAFAEHAFAQKDACKAAQILGVVEKHMAEWSVRLIADEEAEYQQHRAAVRAALSPASFEKANREGASWTQAELSAKLRK